MLTIQKSKLLLLFLEAIGVFTLFSIFSNILMPFFSNNMGFPGEILFWLSYGLFCAIIAYFVRKVKAGWSWKDLGFKVHRSWRKDIWFGILIFSLFYLFEIPLTIILIPTQAQKLVQQMNFLQQMSLPIAFLMLTGLALVLGFITGAFHEEIRYRGYLQGLFSKEITPAFGLFISLIPFSFNHYFSHSDWNFLQVINTILPGLSFCLGYYATGSLIVSMTTHTLSNLIPSYPILFYMKDYKDLSYISVFLFSAFFAVLIFLGKDVIKYLLQKTYELFTVSGLKSSLLGIVLGIIFLFLYHWLGSLQSLLNVSKEISILILLAFSLICISLSMIKINKK